MKRLLFAAIAVSVMVGCTDEQKVMTESGSNGSDIPVNIEYRAPSQRAARSAESSRAVATVVEANGNVKECALSMGDGTLAGVIEDVDCAELVQVTIELFDENGVLTYKGKDIVEKVNDSLYECVNSDLYAVDSDGKVILDEGVIHDINGSNTKLSESAIGQFLALIMQTINLSDETQGQITEAVLDREWTASELLLVEQFIHEIHDVIKKNGSILIWDKDTVDVMETGKLFTEEMLNVYVVSIAEEYSLDVDEFTKHLVENSDFYNLPWYEGQKEAVYAYLELEAKKLTGAPLFYESYDEVKAVCFEMSEAANVEYTDVMDELGADFWENFWRENNSSVVKAKIAEAITKVPQKVVEVIDTGFYSSYAEVKQVCYDMATEAGVEHVKVMDVLGSKFWDSFWQNNNISEVNKEIKSAVAQVVFFETTDPDTSVGGYYVNVEEVKELTYGMAKTYGANHDEVVAELGAEFFETFWQENDRDAVQKKIMSAVEKVNFLDSMNPGRKYHYLENVEYVCYKSAENAQLDVKLVIEKLGNEFFDTFWRENSRKAVDAKVKEAVDQLLVDYADYFTDYGQVKDLCYNLSEEAGVNYVDVMDLLGQEFWDSFWKNNPRDVVEAKIAEAVSQAPKKEVEVINNDFYTNYDDVHALCIKMSELAGVDYKEVFEVLGDEFKNSFWRENNMTEVKKEISKAVDEVAFFDATEPQ